MGTRTPDPRSVPRARWRERGLAALLLIAGLAVAMPFLTGDPSFLARLPTTSDAAETDHNIRILSAMLAAEGALLWLLAGMLVLRGHWLRLGGLRMLERHPRKILMLLVILHGVSMTFYFPLEDIFSNEPVITCDNAYHYYQVYAMDQFMTHNHHRWGYDPYFMAGYPAGVLFDLDMKGAELFCHVLSGIGLERAHKAYIVLSILLFPFVIYVAARLLGLSLSESLVALLLALAFWHSGRPLLGHFKWAGMQSYIFASHLTVLALALFYRLLDVGPHRRMLCTVALTLLVAVALDIHPLTGLIIAPGFMLGYVARSRHLRLRDHVALWSGLAFTFGVNSDWILNYFHFRHYKTASNFFFQLQGWNDFISIYTRETSIIFTAITLFGFLGLAVLRRRSGLAASITGVSATLYLIAAFFGSRVPEIANTEPGRYVVPFAFLMSIPAALALVALLGRAQRLAGPQLIVVAVVLATSCLPFLSILDSRFFYVYKLSARIDPRFHELMDFLGQTTSRDARILFETPGGLKNASQLLYGGHNQALVPIYTRREMIGGPYPTNFLVHSKVDFKNGELLGRFLRDWTSEDFAGFLDTYNVGWVTCWSEEAWAYLDARPALVRLEGEIRGFRVYRVHGDHSYVLEGRGKTSADYNRIEVTGVEGQEIILKYHWMESLRTSPELPLERVPIRGDPIGFIRVRPQGKSKFTIYNAY